MLNNIEKDERTAFVENESYRYGYSILNFGILIDIMYRALMFNEAAWDLFAIIFWGGLIITIYQYKGRILTKKWAKTTMLVSLVSAIVAALFIIIFKIVSVLP